MDEIRGNNNEKIGVIIQECCSICLNEIESLGLDFKMTLYLKSAFADIFDDI